MSLLVSLSLATEESPTRGQRLRCGLQFNNRLCEQAFSHLHYSQFFLILLAFFRSFAFAVLPALVSVLFSRLILFCALVTFVLSPSFFSLPTFSFLFPHVLSFFRHAFLHQLALAHVS